MQKVVLIFGTRPEAIKMAPVYKTLMKYVDILDVRVCVTAQHRSMLDQVLSLFDIISHHDLDIMSSNQNLYDITNRVIMGLHEYLASDPPDFILVHGDTTTTFAAALAAFYQKIPVGHVEAGLRTGNRYSPFPEEMNRKLTTALTSLHLAPTQESCANLLRENISRDDILVTGNTAIDALHMALALPQVANLPSMFPSGKRGILVTAHRRENFGEGIQSICRALRRICQTWPDVHIVYPVHFNPNIRVPVQKELAEIDSIKLLDPVEYDVFVRLMADSYLILTDSGGVQEEAPSLGKPVLVLRECTERPEAVAAGTVSLVGTAEDAILSIVQPLLDDPKAYSSMARAVNPYGDGKAAPRIASGLLRRLGHSDFLAESLKDFTN